MQKLTSIFGGKGGSSKGPDMLSVAELVGGLIALCGTVFCCCGVAAYIGFSSLVSNNPAPKQAAGPRKVKAMEGVSLSNLLTASDIEDRLDTIQGTQNNMNY